MNLFRLFFLATLLLSAQPAFAQKQDKAVKAVINRFFEGMEKGDTTLLLSTCTEAPVLQTFVRDKSGKFKVRDEDFRDFVRFIGTPTQDKYDEKIKFAAIHIEESLASVWAPYKFYRNGTLSHCGTNSFQLVKTEAGWKIQYIIDTRRKTCK